MRWRRSLRARPRAAQGEMQQELTRIYATHFTEQDSRRCSRSTRRRSARSSIAEEPKACEESMQGARDDWSTNMPTRSTPRSAPRCKKRATTDAERPRRRRQTEGRDMSEEVDLFVIGAGSGGVRAARIASGYGARVMIAEEYRVGGTCVIRGCVPKKLLVYASRFADEFEDAAGYGWTLAEPKFDWADADRQQGQGDRPAGGGLHRQSRARQGQDRQEPRGDRRSAHRQALATGETVRAKHILIATGGCALARQGHRGPRARHLVERGVPSARSCRSAS